MAVCAARPSSPFVPSVIVHIESVVEMSLPFSLYIRLRPQPPQAKIGRCNALSTRRMSLSSRNCNDRDLRADPTNSTPPESWSPYQSPDRNRAMYTIGMRISTPIGHFARVFSTSISVANPRMNSPMVLSFWHINVMSENPANNRAF